MDISSTGSHPNKTHFLPVAKLFSGQITAAKSDDSISVIAEMADQDIQSKNKLASTLQNNSIKEDKKNSAFSTFGMYIGKVILIIFTVLDRLYESKTSSTELLKKANILAEKFNAKSIKHDRDSASTSVKAAIAGGSINIGSSLFTFGKISKETKNYCSQKNELHSVNLQHMSCRDNALHAISGSNSRPGDINAQSAHGHAAVNQYTAEMAKNNHAQDILSVKYQNNITGTRTSGEVINSVGNITRSSINGQADVQKIEAKEDNFNQDVAQKTADALAKTIQGDAQHGYQLFEQVRSLYKMFPPAA